ncbi:lipopolysaccharide biosynthesis protein (plasmid) [Deinococcus sp. KNUC1210]|uniref:lipopolysaccharide biosynthesis protein n=1 Tax=Deinococcus sp. KNUC1210 TaxID=2917691 RepID=UPI001EF00ACF|nr:lipopolysaccharide biosynthesis protein [Deinococcus sp. KNUC1210]ULH17599.1 lipopolysaccharide biosynthesis protein [Deinococcus sp. KNUC1210]
MTLKAKTVHAIKWSYLSFFANLLLAPVFAAILARLLTKHDFGLFALGMSMYSLGQYIADFGIGQALVQKRDLTDEDVRAGVTASLLLGLSIMSLAWLLAPLAGTLLRQPEVVPLFRTFACLYLLASLLTVATALLRRALRFRPLMIGEVGGYVLGQGVFGLGAAALGFGAYSLAISLAVQYLFQFVVTYLATRHSFRLTFRRESFRALSAFGGRAALINCLEFVSANLDTFLIGRWYGTATLGLYNRGFNAVCMPINSLARSITRVLAPSFSRVQHQQDTLRRSYLSGLLVVSITLFSAAAGVFVCAREIVLVLLGPSFASAIPIVQVLAFFIPFPVLSNISAVLAEASARLTAKIVIQLVYLLLLAAAFTLVVRLGWGVIAFAQVLVVAGALRCFAYALVARRIIGGGGWATLLAYVTGIGCGLGVGVVMFAAVSWARMAGMAPFALLGLELLLGALLLGGVLLLGPPNEVQRQVRPLLRARLTRWRNAAGEIEQL